MTRLRASAAPANKAIQAGLKHERGMVLFNLEDDPGERTDLAGQLPEIRDELTALVPGA